LASNARFQPRRHRYATHKSQGHPSGGGPFHGNLAVAAPELDFGQKFKGLSIASRRNRCPQSIGITVRIRRNPQPAERPCCVDRASEWAVARSLAFQVVWSTPRRASDRCLRRGKHTKRTLETSQSPPRKPPLGSLQRVSRPGAARFEFRAAPHLTQDNVLIIREISAKKRG
jgi:hypothetical protein